MSNQKKNTANKKKKSVSICDVHIHMTFNNIITSITTPLGDVIAWASAGKMGFRGKRRSTPFAAKVTVENAMRAALDMNMKTIRGIIIRGICSSREAAVREVMKIVSNKGMPPIEFLRDMTPVPHNGCQPPKRRRV